MTKMLPHQLSSLWAAVFGFAVALLVLVATSIAQENAASAKKSGPTEMPTPAWLPKPIDVADSVATDEATMKPYTESISGTDAKFQLVPIKAGKFVMGSPESEDGHDACEGPQHEVEIEPFWMGTHEVTWQQYELWCLKIEEQARKIANKTPTDYDKLGDAIAKPTNPYTDMSFGMGKEGYPAVCMTQLAAKGYCKWLSAKTGRYYRLPTEAEWEYACRAGSKTTFSFGNNPKQLNDYGWYLDNSDGKYHKVGTKKPNAWGLYDMHGNVAEWVLDQYAAEGYPDYAGQVAKNPLVPPKGEYNRVVRGGSWDDEGSDLRSAARKASTKEWKAQDPQIPQSIWYLTDASFVGFRLVRPLRVPSVAEAKKYDLDDSQLEEIEDYAKARASN